MKPCFSLCLFFFFVALCSGQALHQDSRCLCKCPEAPLGNLTKKSFVNFDDLSGEAGGGDKGTKKRSIYVNSLVTPEDCDCKHVVLPHLNMTDAESESFCPRCSCKYETRSLTIIKVVVILVIWVISILVVYMGFLSCLDPILNKRAGLRAGGLGSSAGGGVTYREHHDERTSDDEGSGNDQAAIAREEGDTQMRTYGGAEAVINRLGNQQSKWKRQVQEQRRNIYDRHAMLN